MLRIITDCKQLNFHYMEKQKQLLSSSRHIFCVVPTCIFKCWLCYLLCAYFIAFHNIITIVIMHMYDGNLYRKKKNNNLRATKFVFVSGKWRMWIDVWVSTKAQHCSLWVKIWSYRKKLHSIKLISLLFSHCIPTW